MADTVLALAAIVERCSKFSGFQLQSKVDLCRGIPCLEIFEPGKDRSRLVLTLVMGDHLHEAYGRLWHWNITVAEQLVLKQVLRDAWKALKETP